MSMECSIQYECYHLRMSEGPEFIINQKRGRQQPLGSTYSAVNLWVAAYLSALCCLESMHGYCTYSTVERNP